MTQASQLSRNNGFDFDDDSPDDIRRNTWPSSIVIINKRGSSTRKMLQYSNAHEEC